MCVRAVCACMYFFLLSRSRGSICARTLAFSLGQEVEKSIACTWGQSAHSTHYLDLTLKGSTDCAAESEQGEGVRSAAHTHRQVSIMLCFQLETAIQGGQSWGLCYCLAPTWSVCVL